MERKGKKEQKKGKGVLGKEGTKGTGEGRDRKERRKDRHEETQGYTDEDRCTQMHTDRKKNIQTSTNIGRERNGERERGGGVVERRGKRMEGMGRRGIWKGREEET